MNDDVATGDFATGRRYLRERQYADDRNLAARQSIYVYQQPVVDIWNRAVDLAQLRGNERILDVGCGNGMYLRTLRQRRHRGLAVGLDLSPGMVGAARQVAGDGSLTVGDAQQLPFPDATFDCVLAMHMLYHVPDRARAIAELRRVLRPSGTVLVITNSLEHLRELDDLVARAASTVLDVELRPLGASMISFNVENAVEELAVRFPTVDRHDMHSELVITSVEPVLDYVRSIREFVADSDGALDGVVHEVARRVGAEIDTRGAFRVRTAVGCFVCR